MYNTQVISPKPQLMHRDGVGMGQQSKKLRGWGTTWWGRDMRGRMGTGTDLAGWGGDGDDFHLHARLCFVYYLAYEALPL